MKINPAAAMLFFIILMIAFAVASHLNGEKIQASAFNQGEILCGMIGMFFSGASVMVEKYKMAEKYKEMQSNSKLHEEVIYNEKNSKV